MSWLTRVMARVAPVRTLRRRQARIAIENIERLARHYEAASTGRRTAGWRRKMSDANEAIGPSLATLRDIARDLVRNNPYAESAVSTIVDQVVGWGIEAAAEHDAFKRWAKSTACDASGRHNLAGLQRIVMRGVPESGEMLVRRIWRQPSPELPLPLQLQVLEPDHLDTLKDRATGDGGRVIQGVEFDASGKRVAYWLFPEHPGARSFAVTSRFPQSERIPATDVIHVYRQDRAGQVRAPSWFAPVLLAFKDFDELADATLMKQKVAACLAIVTTNVSGMTDTLGEEDPEKPNLDQLAPGMRLDLPLGRDVKVVEPPSVREYPEFAAITLRALATGIGVTPEDLTGDYTNLPFSAARMSRIRQWGRVQDWRYRLMIGSFLDPVFGWAMEASAIMGIPTLERTDWTAPALPMIEPDKEGLAVQRNIRGGISTLSESIRERGYEPEAFLAEMKRDFERLDELGLVLDSDPRKMTQAGQLHQADTVAELRGVRELVEKLSRELAERPATRRRRAEPPKLNGANGHAPPQ